MYSSAYPSTPWYHVWWKVFTRPTTESFFEISVDPGATTRRSILWVFLTALISSLIAQAPEMVRDWPGYIASRQPVWLLVVPLLALLFLFLSARVILWGAEKILMVESSMPRVLACLAAIFAPAAILSALISLLGEIAIFQLVCGLQTTLFVYAIILEVIAIQAVFGASRSFAIMIWILSWLFLVPLTCLALAAFVMSNPGSAA